MDISRKSAIGRISKIMCSASLFGMVSPLGSGGEKFLQRFEFNVVDYGAQGNGRKNDAKSINKAITAAAKAGGGTVYFPSGTYLAGSIHLKSNVTLYLEQGAVLEAIDEASAYDSVKPFPYENQYQDFGHSHWRNGFLWGENLHNIAILGPGMIHGKGLLRTVADESEKGRGDKAIALKNCQNVTLRDFTIFHGGWFGILATGVDNFTIDNLKIDTNRDGIDIDCCRNVRVSNCSINSPRDDAICPKSSYALGHARVTQDVTITNCTVSGFQEGTMLDATYKPMDPEENSNPTGRIKFGTESNGGFKNITISNCTFDHCRGLALETVDGGLLEDISISNITMRNIGNAPIFMRLGSRMRGPKGTPVGQLRRINIDDVVVYNADKKTGSIISGIPGHPIKDVKISNLRIVYKGGGTEEDAAIVPPEKEDSYPEPRMFGPLPSYGFFVRHAEDISFNNVTLEYQKEEARPAFVLNDVKGADFLFTEAKQDPEDSSLTLENVENLRLHESLSLSNREMKQVDKGTF